MSAFLAIVGDTWRQSKQQIVFFLMIGVMALFTAGFVALPKATTTAEGVPVLGLSWTKPGQGSTYFAEQWDQTYASSLDSEVRAAQRLEAPREALEQAARAAERAFQRYQAAEAAHEPPPTLEPLKAEASRAAKELDQRKADLEAEHRSIEEEKQRLVEARSQGMTPLEKGVEVWLSIFASWLFTLSMLGFIAACAGYYPNMLAAGAVDVLVSKPVGRHVLFFGKYAGGLVLYAVALLGCYLLAFVGLGLRTGVWLFSVFNATTLTLFSVALLYAIVGAIGTWTRSTAFALVVGYIFYLVIDGVVGIAQSLASTELAEQVPWVKAVGQWARILFPGFGRLKDAVGASVLHVPVFEAQVLAVAGAWLAACLGLAYWRFKTTDF